MFFYFLQFSHTTYANLRLFINWKCLESISLCEGKINKQHSETEGWLHYKLANSQKGVQGVQGCTLVQYMSEPNRQTYYRECEE